MLLNAVRNFTLILAVFASIQLAVPVDTVAASAELPGDAVVASFLQSGDETDSTNDVGAAEDDGAIISSNDIDSQAVAIALAVGALAALFIYLFWLVVKPRGDERVYDTSPEK